MKTIIGIDPGASGGIAFIFEDGQRYAYKMPLTERDLVDLLKSYDLDSCVVWLEKVHAFPGQGSVSVWSFAQNYGFLRGMLIALEVPLYDVTPQKWQKWQGVTKSQAVSKIGKTKHKNVLKQIAQQHFPELKITHAIADALLIAEYGKNQNL